MDGDFYIDLSQLDKIQTDIIINYFHDNEIVKGSAGTGKSLIALHKIAFVPKGKTFALVVFTRSLKKYFEDGFQALGINEDNVYYRDEWFKSPRHVNYIFVDECQDFNHDDIESFKSNADICFFFGDSDQTIMDFMKPTQTVEQTAKDLSRYPHILTVNYRLTPPIAALAEYVARKQPGELIQTCNKNGGDKPYIYKCNTIDAQLDKIIEIVRNRKLTRVGILVPYNTNSKAYYSPDNKRYLSVEYVEKYMMSHGMPVEVKENSNLGNTMTIDFHTDFPKVLVFHSAKGLQFNDIFIPFCETVYKDEDYKRKQQYVAVTRAWNRLYLLYTGKLNTDIFPPIDSGLYTLPLTVSNI